MPRTTSSPFDGALPAFLVLAALLLSPLFGLGSTKLADNVLAPVSHSCPTGQDRATPCEADVITQKRTTPLIAADHEAHDEVAAEAAALESLRGAGGDPPPLARGARHARRAASPRACAPSASAAPRIQLNERILLVIGGDPGAPRPRVHPARLPGRVADARSMFEQNSYLISGGIFGLALVFLGAFFYFAHWMTQLVKEHRVAVRRDARSDPAPPGRGRPPARRRGRSWRPPS